MGRDSLEGLYPWEGLDPLWEVLPIDMRCIGELCAIRMERARKRSERRGY